MSDGMSLKSRLFRRAFIGLLSMAAILFISAGSLKFRPGPSWPCNSRSVWVLEWARNTFLNRAATCFGFR
jgi:hypothetical protein